MYLDDQSPDAQQLVLSPSDLVDHLACEHLTTLDREVAFGGRPKPDADDPNADIIRRLGNEHEQAVLADLRDQYQVAEIPARVHPREGELLTLEAMRSGAERIYQATFFDGRWRGHADFLVRNDERPSDLGLWSYDVADTKLARHLAMGALVQMGVYGRRLTMLQGVPPQRLTVILGTREEVTVRYADVAAYVRRAMARFESWLNEPPATYPVKVRHCDICPWAPQCRQRWRADDDLIQVAFLRRGQRLRLREAGIGTVAALAAADDDRLAAVRSTGGATLRKLAAQARLQVAARDLAVPPHEPVLPVEPGRGLALLPDPDEGDLFLDLEGDPFYSLHGLEYLWGISDTDDRFIAWWAHDPAAERHAFEQVVDHIMDAWKRHPGMHVYHYAPYEPSRLKDLSQRYGSRIDEVDALLRGERLVDLYAVVRQGLRVGTESYSIKALEQLYDPAARAGAAVKDAGSSIVEYERWRAEGDQSILDAIEAYNRDDCLSTRRLRDWLEDRRLDLQLTGVEVPRPAGGFAEPEIHHHPPDPAAVAVEAALTRGLPADPAERDDEQRARGLLADLLQWHRRENRAEWWEYFRVRALSTDELIDDASVLGGLAEPTFVRAERQSVVWRYTVPPQECRLRVGDRVDHAGADGSSKLVTLDLERGLVELKRARRNEHPHPAGLLPAAPVDTAPLAAALLDVGGWVARHGIDAPGPYRGVRDLLLGHPPLLPDGVPLRHDGEPGSAALVRVSAQLAGALAVQGPPGSGKTYAGSRAIVEMIRAGRTVGICGPSHRAITNLLDGVLAADRDGAVRAVQKADGSAACRHPQVTVTPDNGEVEQALALGAANLVAGTSWLYARPAIRVDALVVDEAGQLSLANTVAAGSAADAVILLGDPQQLPQPAKGVHPDGAGISALEHVLGDHDTLPAGRGLFLDTTYRMHPAVCAPVSELSYEGRLSPRGGLDAQLVGGHGPLAGAGVRWFPVPHTGRSVESPEEADVVTDLVGRLTGRPWTDACGATRTLGPDDILVVAPYNVQVSRLLARLGGRARVGTVDKFQGQQAPVVIVSLTTSSATDAPRGVHFVANRQRLNVAVSRARSLAILVGSPALLTSPVASLEQLQGVNALCGLVEHTADFVE